MAQENQQGSSLFETIQLLSLDLISNLEDKRISLLEMFAGIEIFESILEPFITARLMVADTLDLYANFPLVGNETIELSIKERTTNINRKFTFKVYKLDQDDKVTRGSSKVRLLDMQLCSPEMVNNGINRISRKFSGNPVANIQWMLDNPLASIKELTSIAPEGDVDFYANFNKPSTAIQFLARQSKGSSGMDYVFYETLDGFHFEPISYLMDQDFVENLRYLADRELQTAFRIDTIKLFTQDSYFDHIMNWEFGLFGKTLYKLKDNNRYGFLETAKTFIENTTDITNLGRNSLFDSELDSARNLVVPEYHDHDVKQARTAMMSTILNNNNIVVRTNGTLDRIAGNTLNLFMPNIDNVSETSESFDGKWLILSIKHIISNSAEYEQNMLLTKNARRDESRLPGVTGKVSL